MGLTNQEIEELDAFLLSDDGRENAMDVSGVDGFLCAVGLIGSLLWGPVIRDLDHDPDTDQHGREDDQ